MSVALPLRPAASDAARARCQLTAHDLRLAQLASRVSRGVHSKCSLLPVQRRRTTRYPQVTSCGANGDAGVKEQGVGAGMRATHVQMEMQCGAALVESGEVCKVHNAPANLAGKTSYDGMRSQASGDSHRDALGPPAATVASLGRGRSGLRVPDPPERRWPHGACTGPQARLDEVEIFALSLSLGLRPPGTPRARSWRDCLPKRAKKKRI